MWFPGGVEENWNSRPTFATFREQYSRSNQNRIAFCLQELINGPLCVNEVDEEWVLEESVESREVVPVGLLGRRFRGNLYLFRPAFLIKRS